jgi:hypothetical protein
LFLAYSSSWPVNERREHTKNGEAKERDCMLNVLATIGNNMGNTRNQEKHPKGYANNDERDSTKEESRVLHVYTFLR